MGHFIKDYRQSKKLPWKPVPQKNVSIVDIEYNIVIIERILFFIDFRNVFTSISLNASNIKLKENSDIDKSKEFNIDIQIYLTSEKEYKEFIVINVNLNIVKNDGEEYPYDKDDLYLEFNNIGYHSIV